MSGPATRVRKWDQFSQFHSVLPPPPLNYGGWTFWFSKNFLRGVGIFFILRGVSPHGGACQNSLWRGDSTFKNGIVYLFFHFLNLARWYSCTILTVLSYIIIRIPDFGVGTTIMLSSRYVPKVVQVKLWTLAWKWWIVR